MIDLYWLILSSNSLPTIEEHVSVCSEASWDTEHLPLCRLAGIQSDPEVSRFRVWGWCSPSGGGPGLARHLEQNSCAAGADFCPVDCSGARNYDQSPSVSPPLSTIETPPKSNSKVDLAKGKQVLGLLVSYPITPLSLFLSIFVWIPTWLTTSSQASLHWETSETVSDIPFAVANSCSQPAISLSFPGLWFSSQYSVPPHI